MSDVGGDHAGGRQSARAAPRRTDGELILLWTLPVALMLWIASFVLFPGFNPPMSPTMPISMPYTAPGQTVGRAQLIFMLKTVPSSMV